MQNRWIMPRSIEGAPWNVFFSFVFRVVYAVKEIRRGMRIKFEGHANWVNRTKTWIELATGNCHFQIAKWWMRHFEPGFVFS
jgi:hypothetical protein